MNLENESSGAKQEPDLSAGAEELWKSFTKQYPTNEACLKAIVKWLREEGGAACPGCGTRDFKVKTGRKGRCSKCHSRFSVTARTFFEDMKAPKAWYAAIWLMERGVTLNAVEFSKKVMVAQSSARSILKRIMAVIGDHMGEGMIESISADFMKLFAKRSAETEAREHPRSEEEAMQKRNNDEKAEEGNVSQSEGDNKKEEESQTDDQSQGSTEDEPRELPELSEEAALILKLLTGTPKSISELCKESGLTTLAVQTSMTLLELEGGCKRMPGGNFTWADKNEIPEKRFKRFDPVNDLRYSCDPETRAAQREAIKYISSRFRGISRKYLQLYLNAHWCFADRKRWSEGAILKACMAHRPLREKDLFAMVTSCVVRFAPSTTASAAI